VDVLAEGFTDRCPGFVARAIERLLFRRSV
jgi:hypothetical protein